MLTKEQYFAVMERIRELCDKGFNNLSSEEDAELDRLSNDVQEFEAHDHRTASDNA